MYPVRSFGNPGSFGALHALLPSECLHLSDCYFYMIVCRKAERALMRGKQFVFNLEMIELTHWAVVRTEEKSSVVLDYAGCFEMLWLSDFGVKPLLLSFHVD